MMLNRLRAYVTDRFRNLRGDPHYIALGMAVGVFTGVTPTFPFHTAIAVGLAACVRGSKRAAALGSWFGNPLTMPLFYIGSYKTGMWLFGNTVSFRTDTMSLANILETGIDVTCIMLSGGILLGLLPALAAYGVTRSMMRMYHQRRRMSEKSGAMQPACSLNSMPVTPGSRTTDSGGSRIVPLSR